LRTCLAPLARLLRRRRRSIGRRWDGAVFGAQVGDQLSHLLVGEGVAEGRHLLSAVEDLGGDLGRRPKLVLADVDQRGRLFAADAADAVAVGAALVAEEDGAGLLRFDACLGVCWERGAEGKRHDKCGEKYS